MSGRNDSQSATASSPVYAVPTISWPSSVRSMTRRSSASWSLSTTTTLLTPSRADRLRGRLDAGQRHDEARAAVLRALGADGPALRLDELAADVETESGAGGRGRAA